MPSYVRSRLLDLPPVDQPVEIATLADARAVLEAHRLRLRLGERDVAKLSGYNKAVFYNFTHAISVPSIATFLHFNETLGCRVFVVPRALPFRDNTQT